MKSSPIFLSLSSLLISVLIYAHPALAEICNMDFPKRENVLSYSGTCVQGKASGSTKVKYKTPRPPGNECEMQAEYHDGVRNGPVTIRCTSGSNSEGEYANGRPWNWTSKGSQTEDGVRLGLEYKKGQQVTLCRSDRKGELNCTDTKRALLIEGGQAKVSIQTKGTQNAANSDTRFNVVFSRACTQSFSKSGALFALAPLGFDFGNDALTRQSVKNLAVGLLRPECIEVDVHLAANDADLSRCKKTSNNPFSGKSETKWDAGLSMSSPASCLTNSKGYAFFHIQPATTRDNNGHDHPIPGQFKERYENYFLINIADAKSKADAENSRQSEQRKADAKRLAIEEEDRKTAATPTQLTGKSPFTVNEIVTKCRGYLNASFPKGDYGGYTVLTIDVLPAIKPNESGLPAMAIPKTDLMYPAKITAKGTGAKWGASTAPGFINVYLWKTPFGLECMRV